MRILPFILFIAGAVIAHASAPLPYAGKLSVDQINYSGNASFSFEILDENDTVLWQNGEGRIEAPVNRGRYLVLLGGQGMNPLPTELIHRDISLFLRVRVDLGDGEGVRLLSPDVAISTSPRALVAEIAKLADRATVARSARPGSISLNDFSADLRSSLSSMLAPDSISGFPVDGLTPSFANEGSSISVRLGDSLTLSAPSTPGANLTYSWQRNGALIEGATQPSLQITADEAVYTVTVQNALGSSEARFSTYRIKGSRFSTSSHSMWVDENGSLWGVGRNDVGQLGIGSTSFAENIPVKVVDGGVVAVVLGNRQSFFIKSGGSLWAMGANMFGQLGDGTKTNRSTPVKIRNSGVVQAGAGWDYGMYVLDDGSLWSFGYNHAGQLGTGNTETTVKPHQVLDAGVSRIALIHSHALILKTDGSLWGLGANYHGQLGTGTTVSQNNPVKILDGGVVSIAAGEAHSVFSMSDGSAWTIGHDRHGQLGNGDATENSLTPIKVIEGGVQTVGASINTSYFLMEDGKLLGCGANGDGQLGLNHAGGHQLPILIAENVEDISAGNWGILFSRSDGKLYGIGVTKTSQFSEELPYVQKSPVEVFDGGVEKVVATRHHDFYFMVDSSLFASGENEGGRLGSNYDKGDRFLSVPTGIFDTNVTAISSDEGSTLFIKNDNSLWATGWNGYGQLGVGNTTDVNTPTKIDDDVIAVSAKSHVLYTKTDGSLWAMGRNDFGQLGDGTTIDRYLPVKVVDENVTAVSVGGSFSMFMKSDGSVWSMGSNERFRLGYGGQGDQHTPVLVMNSGAHAISASWEAGYIVDTNGGLWSFGNRGWGRLGEGETADRRSPVKVVQSGVTSFASGGEFAIFVKTDGAVWGMGRNDMGQLGNDLSDKYNQPRRIIDSGAQAVSAAHHHSMVLMQDGSVLAFGRDDLGQLGLGRMLQTGIPVLLTETLAPKLGE